MEHECCEEYEHCVSCCQAPQHSNASLLLEVYRGPDRCGSVRCVFSIVLDPRLALSICIGSKRSSLKRRVTELALRVLCCRMPTVSAPMLVLVYSLPLLPFLHVTFCT